MVDGQIKMSDEELMRQLQNGQKETFDEIVLRYKDRLVNFIYRFSGNKKDSEDIAIETFLRVYQNSGSYDSSRPFSSWFYKIAMNLTLNRIREIKSHPTISLSEEIKEGMPVEQVIAVAEESPQESLLRNERAARVKKAISGLPEHLRSVIIMREYQDMDYETIASVLDCPIGTVRSRLSRARELLKKTLKDLMEE
ncbi:MAG: hypothetical protein COX46_00485 [bacterium (Candidatus Ratteibacteria) CG23_combo_of_CG06-09_8_20_14_all_48_7]|uniref:RNA polymerase subunit sigma-24 n=1 Tax=bacterium (Candidatus Ratteibacteria) CG23_combo_of_CG06-09_8_20_14_all_48_7 TaxID=2014292 RepID=A0A2G9YBW1_9BACT|nr:MAG: hypothetical protein COX46_00485 [bacterium (Candidatus Ratteibacteria) CG23_combo_of_CG06-09_8_20_14_all_48_7]